MNPNNKHRNALSTRIEENVDKCRCQRGLEDKSAINVALAVMSAGLTHPVVASLGHPLFAFGGKRVKQVRQKCSYPLSREAEERVDQRSVVGVSQRGGHYRQCTSASRITQSTHRSTTACSPFDIKSATQTFSNN
jgi:hypothetical protein